MQTVWVFGDQLNRKIGALADAKPATHRILMVESRAKITNRRWHVQRAHFIVASMRRFAAELREAGFKVDYRFAESMRAGVQAHRKEFSPSQIVVTEPNSYAARELVASLDLTSVKSNQFLCHPDEYAGFRATRKTVKMEDFYRWQRTRLDVMMDGDDPAKTSGTRCVGRRSCRRCFEQLLGQAANWAVGNVASRGSRANEIFYEK
jgi:deoxyribodipyrimidine photolyase-related protein